MPAEYYTWLETLRARDTIALASAVIAAIIFLVMLRSTWLAAGVTKTQTNPLKVSKTFRVWEALSNKYYLTLFAIAMLGLTLRLINLGANSLWYDEALSALTAQRAPLDILTIAKYSNHPPGYYLLLWAWSWLWPGQPSEWWLRFPSLALGTVNITLVYLVARQFQRPRLESLTAALLMAVLPFQLFYSQEARMYELMLFAALMTLSGYQQKKWWVVIVYGALGMYTQTMFALFLISLLIMALVDKKQPLFETLLPSYMLIGFLYAPWAIWAIQEQVGRVAKGWIPQVSPGGFAYLWHVLLWGEANPAPVIIPGLIASMLLTISALAFAAIAKEYKLLILTLTPPLLAVIASLTLARVFLPRPFIVVTPALYILIAAVLWRAPRRRWLAGTLAAMLIIALWGYYFNPTLQKWPHKEWAAEIESRYRERDAIFYISHFLPFWWYLQDKPSYFLTQDDDAPNAGFNLSNQASRALGMTLISPDELAGYKRAFVLHAMSPAATPYKTEVNRRITSDCNIIWQHKFLDDAYIATGSMALVDLQSCDIAAFPRPNFGNAGETTRSLRFYQLLLLDYRNSAQYKLMKNHRW